MKATQTLTRSCAIVFALLTLSALPMLAGVNRWTSLGPRSEAVVNALVADPAAPDTVYAATAGGGVFKSEDGGETWTAVNTGLDDGSVTALAIDPTAPETLYAATDGSGVFKTTDGGETWRRAAGGIANAHVMALALDPTQPSTLYAGSSGGEIYKTTDGAETWRLAHSWDGLIRGLFVSAGSGSAVYAVVSLGLYRSPDGENNWREVQASVSAFALDPRNPGTFYLSVNGLNGQLIKTTDGGATWKDAGSTPFPVSIIAVSPSDPTRILAGTWEGRLYSSTDAAATWRPVTGLSDESHSVRALLFFGPASTCMVARAATLLKGSTEDGSAPFRQVTDGLQAPSIGVVAANPPDSTTLLATDGFQILRSGDGGENWSAADTGSATFFNSIAWLPGSRSTVLAGPEVGALRSEDGGLSWHPTELAGELLTYVNAFSFDPASPSTVYAGTSGGLQKSTDGGQSWKVTAPDTYLPTYSVLADKLNSSSLYAIHAYETAPFSYQYYFSLDKSTDGGATWKDASKGLPQTPSSASNLVSDPNDARTLFVGIPGDGVFKSTDGALSWKPAGGGLEGASVTALAIDPAATLYAATDRGVFRSFDRAATWLPFNDGLTNLRVLSLGMDATGRLLHAGTAGGGLFAIDIEPPSFPCEADGGRACLLAGRFQVTASARPATGNLAPVALPVSMGDGFGEIRLGRTDAAPDIFVKMVDGRALAGNAFWVFHTGLTDDDYVLTVTDTATRRSKIYQRAAYQSGCGGIDTFAFPDARAAASAFSPVGTLSPGDGETLPLSGGRYRVTLSATDPRSGRGALGLAMPQGDLDGYFSLPEFTGDAALPEVFARIRARQDGSFVFSHTGLTDLSYVLTVTDSSTGAVATYANNVTDELHPCGGSVILAQ